MCGCRNAYTNTEAHDEHCICACHRGVVNTAYRCRARKPIDANWSHVCGLRAEHDGRHRAYGNHGEEDMYF